MKPTLWRIRQAASMLSLAALAAAPLAATAQVTTSVYTGYTASGDGTPFTGLVGTLTTPGITFGTATGFNWHPFGLSAFGSQSAGQLSVEAGGLYTFNLTSDDGSSLFIDGVKVIDNGGGHGPFTASGSATLGAGTHSFTVNFFEDFGGQSGLDLALPNGVTVAVPEPSTLAFWLAGGAALGAWKLRRRR